MNKLNNLLKKRIFKIEIFHKSIYIAHFTEIITLEENRISITDENRLIIITGNNLVVSRLLDKEILITGEIKKIELG